MKNVTVQVEGGGPIAVTAGSTLLDVARVAAVEDALVARRGDELVDLTAPALEGDRIAFLTYADAPAREVFRHTASHLLAHALTDLYPGVKLALGPATADGFYYDVDLPADITDADLPRVEERMRALAAADAPFERLEISKDEARRLFAGNP